MSRRTLSLNVFIPCVLAALAPLAGAQGYRVFDWQGKSTPAQPSEGPPGSGAVTHTTYLSGGQCWTGDAFLTMDVEIDVSVSIWDVPARWRVDPEGFVSGGNLATYGYQSPDEAEFHFGDPNVQVVMRFDVRFSQPVNNPSFFLMDIDNNGSDYGSQFKATTLGGGTVYPSLSLVAGSTVAWTGADSVLEVFSSGGASTDNQATGSAFFEWHETSITGISFVWESFSGSTIRMSNIYGEYDPSGFMMVVPEPSAGLLAIVAAGGIILRRRRR